MIENEIILALGYISTILLYSIGVFWCISLWMQYKFNLSWFILIAISIIAPVLTFTLYSVIYKFVKNKSQRKFEQIRFKIGKVFLICFILINFTIQLVLLLLEFQEKINNNLLSLGLTNIILIVFLLSFWKYSIKRQYL